MDLERFEKSSIGRLDPVIVLDGETTYSHAAFVPFPLPDKLDLDQRAWGAVTAAAAAVARLDGAARRLQNPYVLVRPSLTEEAVSTSALEGTYAAFEDVLQADFLDSSEVSAQTVEVRNYITAAEHGLELIKELAICQRLAREVHRPLMRDARGDYAEAGEFRTRQNWIGPRRGTPITESLFVPPPAGTILDQGLTAWEEWVNRDNGLSTLVKVALGHYQFETLHPFIDGNGRVGRLLAILTLIESGDLEVPLLNISPYLEQRRDEYVDHLRVVSETGDFEPWIVFFSEAVRSQAERALTKADRLIEVNAQMAAKLHAAGVRGVAHRIAEGLVGGPVITATRAAELYGVSFQAANNGISRLVEQGILREITGRPYDRLFTAPQIIQIISE
jgi:Fic family protein